MIRFEEVSKVFHGEVKAVDGLSLEVKEGETLVLLGTSGSGKTTTMKMVNRLIDPTSGTISINDEDVMGKNPVELRRTIGYTVQHIGLFPHMTVGENIAVVPRLLGWNKSTIGERVDELLNLVGMDPDEYRGRYPNQLSGGQRQRIGVARSLAADPPLILMDEPFGALDPITREQLQNEFLDLESEIQKTIIFVTHDVFEAVKMGDRVAILDAGKLQQVSTPRELVESPANEFVDQFLGQHRFQLALLTCTVGELVSADERERDDERKKLEKKGARLNAGRSLIDALDMFKRHGTSRLPVYRKEKYLGMLSRKRLSAEIAQVMGTVEEEGEG